MSFACAKDRQRHLAIGSCLCLCFSAGSQFLIYPYVMLHSGGFSKSVKCKCLLIQIFNRPGVDGAVLQTSSLVINSESSFVEIYSDHLHSQSGKAKELTFWGKAHLPPPVMCRMSRVMFHGSCVMCHMSCVTCHMSCVTCHMSKLYFVFFFPDTVMEPASGGSAITRATPSSFLYYPRWWQTLPLLTPPLIMIHTL